ncbi:C-type lectin domain family 4 member M-like [Acanthaster planci]|uniref:C-type lectin domain family 4 member M-like n=1 Tax=Acanthaster planci TaxID=133434 RepID=A0A8B7XSD8_ACAPL|nr:C-type lectin domain family 4 member M-like [Acanthaster planci]
MAKARLWTLCKTVVIVFAFVGVESRCPASWIERQTSCYKTDDEQRTWENGEAYCNQLGAELVVIETAQENEFIRELLNDQSKDFAWLGCNDRATERTWVCYSEATVGMPFENWAPSQPNNAAGDDCVSISKSGKWSDSKCSADFVYVICEADSADWEDLHMDVTSSSAAVVSMSCSVVGADGRLHHLTSL